jgi:hypothetical protein
MIIFLENSNTSENEKWFYQVLIKQINLVPIVNNILDSSIY